MRRRNCPHGPGRIMDDVALAKSEVYNIATGVPPPEFPWDEYVDMATNAHRALTAAAKALRGVLGSLPAETEGEARGTESEPLILYECPDLECPIGPLDVGPGPCDYGKAHPYGDYPDRIPVTYVRAGAEAEADRLRRTIAEMAIPLEVLHGQIPYIRTGPLGRKIKALSPELEAEIANAVKAARSALSRFGPDGKEGE